MGDGLVDVVMGIAVPTGPISDKVRSRVSWI